VLRLLAIPTVVAALAVTAAASAAPPPAPPFVPVDRVTIPLPDGYTASTPIWTVDGHHLLFSSGGELRIIGDDGAGLACLTCDVPGDPHFASAPQEAFKDVFPDGRRVMYGDFTRAFVLECTPSVVRCDERRLLPIDASAGDKGGTQTSLGPGVWHLAPDGVHLGWTVTRQDTRAMLVGALMRQPDKYLVTDVKVVNPPGPRGRTDTDPRGWTNGGALYELKGFTRQGAAVDYVTAQEQGNPDVYEVDLATGERRRLTGNPDWDEDNGMSPDEGSLLMHSDRGMHRVDADGLLPRRSFIDYPISLAAAIYYVGTPIGFQCDLQPWLLPGTGDAGGQLLGQPLDPYDGSDVHAQNNVPGRGTWSPDSTRVALTEMSYASGLGVNRLLIAHLDRARTAPKPVVDSTPGAWAQTPAQYTGIADSNAIIRVKGLKAGAATITYVGTILTGGHYSVSYDHYSDDGASFLDGTESIDLMPLLTVLPSHTTARLKLTGAHTGHLKADLTIGRRFGAPWGEGTVDTEYDGYEISGELPKLGGCPKALPTAQPLKLATKVTRGRTRTTVRATVTADSWPTARAGDHFGDLRPVRRATVRFAGRTLRTDARGRATFRVRRTLTGPRALRATAGDTFTPARATVRLPRR
jgi:hypothetical protein